MSKTRLLAIALTCIGTLLMFAGLAMMVAGQDTPTEVPALAPTAVNTIPLPSTVSGVISDSRGPVGGAIVQIQGTDNKTQTASDGTFTLNGLEGTTPVVVNAWSTGHYVGWVTLNPSASDWTGGQDISIDLNPLSPGDNSKYGWYTFEGVHGSAACAMCHREYTEWQADQHSRAAVNHHFLNLYMGTDVNGNVGQPVAYGADGIPLPPDPSQPYTGPGFRLDTPDRAGNCATCHTPIASQAPNTKNCAWSGCHTNLTIERSNGQIDPGVIPSDHLTGDAAEGISCEFCHKIGDVYIDKKTDLPYPDMPGILSLRLYRPKDDSQQVMFGTLVDVQRQDSYLPLLSESKFCAGCHYGVFGGVVGMNQVKDGTVIYNSYGEWLASPYSNPETGKSCQDCHMPVSSADWFVFPEKGGLTRDYSPLHTHTMPGAADENLLQNTVTMTSTAQRVGDQLQVNVSITNDKAGHDVPTDAPIRSVILVVEALDASGNPLALSDGSTNPAYDGNYAGVPGKTFAKILKDNWTGETPTAAFWRPVTIVQDNRLKPLATDTSQYTFAAPAGTVTVNVSLIFRRAFADLMQQKGWNDPDILMEQNNLQVPAN
ncbi:MAG: hypothetical protein ABI690_30830 [Chloroflexota bacterium]